MTESKPTCSNCGHSCRTGEPFANCKRRGAYFPKTWHCGQWVPESAESVTKNGYKSDKN